MLFILQNPGDCISGTCTWFPFSSFYPAISLLPTTAGVTSFCLSLFLLLADKVFGRWMIMVFKQTGRSLGHTPSEDLGWVLVLKWVMRWEQGITCGFGEIRLFLIRYPNTLSF